LKGTLPVRNPTTNEVRLFLEINSPPANPRKGESLPSISNTNVTMGEAQSSEVTESSRRVR
jgi:hypothetical protein